MLIPEKYGVISDGVELEITKSHFSGMDGTEETSVNSIRVMPWGYTDVYSMLNTYPFFCAHRGGSSEWPEMTLRAYTQAVAEGYGCLEVSLGKTSDGVVFGLHDGAINRTSGFPTGTYPAVSTMTWAQVQEHMVLPPEDHLDRDPEPYMLLSELVDAYGSTHVILVDPKFIESSYYPTLLDYMDEHGGPRRWIGKSVGDNPAWAAALRARGYERWGAYYQNDWTAGGATPAGWADWTILGLEFGASQAHYNDMLATGKKIMTHVCFTQANVETAFVKGASGVQVAGTEEVSPYQTFTGVGNFAGTWSVSGTAESVTEGSALDLHTIFGENPPPDLPEAFDDGDPTIITGSAFYSVGTTYWVHGARVWVPADYPVGAGDPTTATLSIRIAPIATVPNFGTAALASATVTLVPGQWCIAAWDVPVKVLSGGAGQAAWITLSDIEDWYFFSDGLPVDPVKASDDTDIYLAEAEHDRGAYKIGADVTTRAETWYGLDIVISTTPPGVVEWSFNEGSGTTATDFISGRVLTVAAGNWATGKNVGGLSSAGGSVVLSDLSGLETTNRTLMFWGYRGNVSGTFRTATMVDAGGADVWSILMDNGSSQYAFRVNLNGTTTNRTGTRLPAETWHHYAMSWDGATLKCYIDGVLAHSVALAGSIADAVELRLMPNGGSQKIDDLRLFDVALTADQIEQYMNYAVDPTFEGSASGSFEFAGIAFGDGMPIGSASTTLTFAGSAAGELPAVGTATQAFNYAGTATGKRVMKGAATSSHTFAGSATGKRVVKGAATASITYVGTAVGTQPKRGSATTSIDFAGSAAGMLDRYGYVEGFWNSAGTATGKVPRRGSAVAGFIFSGTSIGRRFLEGDAEGDYLITGTAFGKLTRFGSAEGDFLADGTAEGSAIALPREGSAFGYFGWDGDAISDPPHLGQTATSWVSKGTARGVSSRRGTAQGDVVVSGTASGSRDGAGTGQGSWEAAGGAHGELERRGPATGGMIWRTRARGRRPAKGTTSGSFAYAGSLTQYGDVPPFEVIAVDDQLVVLATEGES